MKLLKNGKALCDAEFTGDASLFGFAYLGRSSPADIEHVILVAVMEPVIMSMGGGDKYELIEGENRVPVVIRNPSRTPADLVIGVCVCR